jgi:hypothetical protein
MLALLALAVIAVGGLSSGSLSSPFAASKAEAAPATSLRLTSLSCLPGGSVRMEVAWNPSGHGVQWLDLSLFNNNFAPGTFIGAGPLSPGQNVLFWDGLLPGRPHFIRVNTASPEGWTPTQTLSFTTPTCTNFSGASNVQLTSHSCLANGLVRLNLQWQPSQQGVQWVDFSTFNNGFVPGTFSGIGPLSPGQNTLTVDNMPDNRTLFVRVNTLTPVGWIAAPTIAFNTRNCQPSGFDTDTVIVNGGATPQDPAILTDVRIAAHPGDGFDRIVFEYDDELPDQTRIRYENAAIRCGSGNEEPVAGSGTLIVRMTATQAHDEEGDVTVPDLDIPGTGVAIREAVSICDFEGIVEWAVGIDGTRPFRVTTLSNPSRIVIDVLR